MVTRVLGLMDLLLAADDVLYLLLNLFRQGTVCELARTGFE